MKPSFAILAFMLTIAVSGAALAQSNATPSVTKRQIRQQERVKQGVRSGELTRKEARRLEIQQVKIQHDKLEAKSDSVVTPAERKHIQREENRASRNIYRKKHNAAKRNK